MVFILLYIFLKCSGHNDGRSEQWIGNYSFYEFAEPNQNLKFTVPEIFEEGNFLLKFTRTDGVLITEWTYLQILTMIRKI